MVIMIMVTMSLHGPVQLKLKKILKTIKGLRVPGEEDPHPAGESPPDRAPQHTGQGRRLPRHRGPRPQGAPRRPLLRLAESATAAARVVSKKIRHF